LLESKNEATPFVAYNYCDIFLCNLHTLKPETLSATMFFLLNQTSGKLFLICCFKWLSQSFGKESHNKVY